MTSHSDPQFGQWLRVRGAAEPLDPAVAAGMTGAVHAVAFPVALELRAHDAAVEIGLRCESRRMAELERAVRGAAPHLEIEPAPVPGWPASQIRRTATLKRPGCPDWMPLREIGACADLDPLSRVLEAAPVLGVEQLMVRCLVRPASERRKLAAQQDLTQPLTTGIFADLFGTLFNSMPRGPRFEAHLQRLLEQRLARPGFEVQGTVCIGGTNLEQLTSRARSLTAVFASAFDEGFGGVTLEPWSWRAGPDAGFIVWHEDTPSIYVSDIELAALWHVPSDGVLTPGVSRLRRSSIPLPPQVERARGLVLGVHQQRGRQLAVRLPRADLEAGHAVIPGRTGVGKSTLQHQIVRQLVAAPDHPTVGVIDPHGDLVVDIAARSIPPQRIENVVLLDLGDTEFPIGLPLFWRPAGAPEEAVVQSAFSILRLIFYEKWSPTRMEDAVFALTATLCHRPGATLLDVPRLLSDPIFRRQAIACLDDPAVLEFWSDYETLSEAGKREVSRPVLYRLRALYRSRAVRNIVCQPDGLDFSDLLDRSSIILVNLAGQAIQAEADVLGELIIARLHLAAMARLARSREDRKPLYLSVDESQRFQGASLPILLAEGRKLGVSLILSTQFLDAWGEQLAESVLGNVGTLIAFRCGPTDSRRLRASIRPFTAEQLEDLDRYEAIVKLQVDGTTMPSFDIRTLPLDAPRDDSALNDIRASTRRRHARSRREIEDQLLAGRHIDGGSWNGEDIDEE